MSLELLEVLAYTLGFDYISDLRFRAITPVQTDEIMALPESDFTLDDFNRAARYVCTVDGDYPNAGAAKQALSIALLRRSSEAPTGVP